MSFENSPQVHDSPEGMRDWLVGMIDSGRFEGLDWLDDEKTIFRVPWIPAKKRGYLPERAVALFREWAIHSGRYRDEGDPIVWKINFRVAINSLANVVELKELQTEDYRFYEILPISCHPRRRPRLRPDSTPSATSFALDGKERSVSQCYCFTVIHNLNGKIFGNPVPQPPK